MDDRPRAKVEATGARTDDDLRRVLSELEELAREAQILVRIEPFALTMSGKGGLCRIDERRVILVDAKLSVLDQVGVVGEALGRALPRGVRVPERLAPYLETGHGKVRPLLRPRPLARGLAHRPRSRREH